ncbi:hypothetical protein DFH07DRAFT_770038 [Mycena maculata]|uniref:Uncharacterized protein n=1 Tax=Mycena maculata TaxID=230809 RepID=A0AAD7NLG5_9AGAR|nr:hypothetical protein DFH07DRAFT_770038 [Mycena maculata]
MHESGLYLDDALIAPLHQAAFKQVTDEIVHTDPADLLVPLLARILQEFEADSKFKAQSVRCPPSLSEKDVGPPLTFPKERKTICPPPVACFSIQLIPYCEKPVLPPVVIPPARCGPKIKTRGTVISALVVMPTPDAEIHVISTAVPKNIYTTLQRIFLPRKKGRVSFPDFQRVMTCVEIGFTCEDAEGSRVHFVPPPVSGLKTYTHHTCALDQQLNMNLKATWRQKLRCKSCAKEVKATVPVDDGELQR